MLKPKMVTAALVAVGVLVCLEYTSVAQQTTPATQQTTSSQPTQPLSKKKTKISTLDRQFITDAEWQRSVSGN